MDCGAWCRATASEKCRVSLECIPPGSQPATPPVRAVSLSGDRTASTNRSATASAFSSPIRSTAAHSAVSPSKSTPENRPAHALIAKNFQGLIGAVRECIEELKPRLPGDTDPDALATYVLAIMEGGVMLSRSYGSVEPFDRTVSQLRQHFRLLLAPETGSGIPKAAKTKKKTRRR
jgi:hypothetical protein